MSTVQWPIAPVALPELTAKTIHVWCANLDLIPIDHLATILSADEKIRAQKFKFPVHQQRFMAARSTLRCILGRYTNKAPESLVFRYAAQGKPYLNHYPALYFNLSHSNQWAIYAIGLEEKIGIDIEHKREDLAIEAIAQRFFSPLESQLIASLMSANEKLTTFFQLWTCKEAFIKAMGAGLAFPLQEFDVDISDKLPRLLAIRGNKKAAQAWSVTSIPFSNDYSAAIAVQTKIEQLKFWTFAV